MSNMKNGFSTLNRWLGKKNKEKSPSPNGKLSKSSTNLSISTTNINDTSQLEYNRIAPLPAITSNAPFEQTFRITVLLPKDQLYVARLGARVPLIKLLELACDHKSLDPEKYEFRNPVDPSQIYNCDLTIGAVGLSEIRLCHKSDSYDSYNADEVMKLHRTSIIRDSLSSSEFSSRNSKHTTKTASPYSSSNSLNSMDSAGMNYTRTPVSPPPALPKSMPPKLAAPPRKKRAAPRPPSQIVIPEKSALVIEHQAAQTEQTIETLKHQQEAMSGPTRKDYYASTPNLSSDANTNGNLYSLPGEIIMNGNNRNSVTITNGNTIEYSDSEYAQVVKKNARNLHGGSVQNLSSGAAATAELSQLPEPSPRKRMVMLKKKAAPAPPPRSSSVSGTEDISSITSSALSTPETPNAANSEKSLELRGRSSNLEEKNENPVPMARETTPTRTQPIQSSTPVSEASLHDEKIDEALANVPKPVPRQTTTTLLNATPAPAVTNTANSNVSKILLNRSPTPEPRSLASESSESTDRLLSLHPSPANENDDNISKHADSGIGEPVPSPLPDSLPSEGSTHECKSTFESSSDDDEIIKTYNFKLGKTILKSTDIEPAPQSLEETKALQVKSGDTTPSSITNENTTNKGISSTFNFSIPISPPPNFADATAHQEVQTSTDVPITPKILERPVLNFENLSTVETKDVTDHSAERVENLIEPCPRTPLPSPSSPINDIIDELSTILNENRMDTLIKRHDEQSEIQAAKPNTLTNFTISTLSTQQITIETETPMSDDTMASTSKTPDSISDEEKLYKKRIMSSNCCVRQLSSVNRADSFHTTSMVNGQLSQNITVTDSNGLNSRSASYLSLSKLDQNTGLNRRRSSSEQSIGESPSLQSLEIIKTILNSRKNSLANSSDGENKAANFDVATGERKAIAEAPKTQRVQSKQLEAASVEPTRPKETPKAYRYSGPPSINFSTWSERPKMQVAIKNEGDYIFGGKNAGTQNAAVTHTDVELRSSQSIPYQQRATLHIMNNGGPKSIPPVVAPKPTQVSTTDRMGIPEREYPVPLTVKPLRDVTVENVETRTSTHKSTVMLNSETSVDIKKTNKLQITQASDTSTLPRAGHGTNRFSTPIQSASGVNLLRATSITQLEKRNSTQNDSIAQTPAPFGQNTLRKTGLKEKILAKEEEAQHLQTNVVKTSPIRNDNTYIRPTIKTSNVHTDAVKSTALSKSTKTLQSAKLELKLQEPTQFSVKKFGITTPLSPQAITPKSAPPAPPMTFLKSFTVRSNSSASATTPTNGDQRDALLEAIRNFKRAELNRV